MTAEKAIDQLEPYDNAIAAWLRRMPVRTIQNQLVIVMATPQKAFAGAAEILAEMGVKVDPQARTTLPTPFVSITRSGEQPDSSRYRGPLAYWPPVEVSADGARAKLLREPLPFTWEYAIEFWSELRTTQNEIRSWVRRQFMSTEVFIPVDLTSIERAWKTKIVPHVFLAFDDNSDLEVDDNAKRVMRSTLRLRVDGWAFEPSTYEALVKTVRVDVHELPAGQAPTTGTNVDAHPETFPNCGQITVP